NDVSLDLVVSAPDGSELRLPTFWAGENIWKARFASPVTGTHRFRTVCSETRDRGLHGVSVQVQVDPYDGDNRLLIHGALRTSLSRRYLEHADGTPFFWLGDTW